MSHVSSERMGSGGISRVRVAMVTRGRCARNKACLSARVLAGAVLGQEMAGGYISCVGARKWLEASKAISRALSKHVRRAPVKVP